MILGIIVVAVAMIFLIAFSSYISDVYLSDEGKRNFDAGMTIGMFMVILTVAEIIMIYNISKEPEPKAIDVYRNKTELEITSVNGVPQDTIVVWKNSSVKYRKIF